MKPSPLSNKLVLILPIVSLIASAAIVTQQSVRRDRLQRELIANGSESARLEKRYNALRQAAGLKPIPDESQPHDHHDDD